VPRLLELDSAAIYSAAIFQLASAIGNLHHLRPMIAKLSAPLYTVREPDLGDADALLLNDRLELSDLCLQSRDLLVRVCRSTEVEPGFRCCL
jgi:hypothetical protein